MNAPRTCARKKGAPGSAPRRRAGRAPALFLSVLLAASAAAAAEPDEHAGHDAMMGAAGELSPQLALHGFSDVTFTIARASGGGRPDSTSSGAALGQFDLYFVSRLENNVSFLGESVFELGANGETRVDVERVFVKYTWSDQLRLAVGRTHTALGYWNEAFHHGTLLQPTVERPEALKFEDDGGILPVHSVGLEVSGEARSGDWALAYVGNVANGRGPTRETVQGSGDLNRDKALGAKLTLAREREGKIAFGAAVYRDLIPPDPSTPARDGEIEELIPGVHLHCRDRHAELLAEGYGIRHHDRVSGRTYQHRTGYAVLVINTPRWKPYFGIEGIDFAPGDPFFAPDDADLDRLTAGLRFELNPFNAVKLEFRHDRREGEETDGFMVQTAFTF